MDWQLLERKVDEFARDVNPGLLESMLTAAGDVVRDVFFGGPPWKQWWSTAREIQQAFSGGVRFPTAQQRSACWEKFNATRGVLAEASKRDRESRVTTSYAHKSIILDKVANARVHGSPGTTREDREILKAAGQELGAAMRLFHDRKGRMVHEHKGEVHAAIEAMKADHDERWRIIRGERERYTADAISRTEENLSKNRERYAKTAAALERQEENARKLRAQLDERSSRSRYDRLSEWLGEAEAKIDSMRENLSRLEGWISQDEERLARLRRR
jgi:hypothetical protein